MSPAPHHPVVVERHAHFDDDDNNDKHDSTSKDSFGKSKIKTPTSQTVFLDDDETPTSQTVFLDDDDSNSEDAKGGEEKKEVTSRTEADNGDDDDDDSDMDEEEERLRSYAFQRHHANKKASAAPHHPKGKGGGGGVGGSLKVKRFDEYSDFLSRSERSRRDKKKGLKEEESKAGGKVNWHPEEKASVQVLPELSDDDASSLYLTGDVWERIDLDLQLTMKRWDNHVTGRIAFDFMNNTIRGMEAMIDEEGSRHRDSVVSRRVKTVLEEQNRQRIAKEFYDAAKMRAVALPTSLQDEASRRGHADAEEAVNIWLGTSSESHRPAGAGAAATTSKAKPPRGAIDKKKKKGGTGGGFSLFGMFQGKNKK